MSIASTILASLESSVHVLLVILCGYLVARSNGVTPPTVSGMSKLTVTVFLPALLLTQITSNMSIDKVSQLWPLLVVYFIFHLIGIALGGIGVKVFNLPSWITLPITFSNATSLPILLLEGLGKTPEIEKLLWGSDDTPAEAVERGISYILICTLLSNICRWSFGPALLTLFEPSAQIRLEETWSEPANSFHSVDSEDEEQRLQLPDPDLQRMVYPSRILELDEQIMTSPDPTLFTPAVTPLFQPVKMNSRHFIVFEKVFQIFNPPLTAAIIAIFVGCIPQLKSLFFGKDPIFGPTVTAALQTVGVVSIPLTMFCLGAQLHTLARRKSTVDGLSQPELFIHKIKALSPMAYIYIVRYIIMPLIAVPSILLLKPYLSTDPVYLFVLMLLPCGPPAIKIINIADLRNIYQREMARTLLGAYILVPLIGISVAIILRVVETDDSL